MTIINADGITPLELEVTDIKIWLMNMAPYNGSENYLIPTILINDTFGFGFKDGKWQAFDANPIDKKAIQ